MDILPVQPPGPSRQLPNISRQHAILAVVVVVALVVGYLVVKGGGSSAPPAAGATPSPATSSATAPASAAPGAQLPHASARSLVDAAERSLFRIKWGHSYTQITGSNGTAMTEDLRGGPQVETETDIFSGHLADVVVLHKVAWIRADEVYLENIAEFPASIAPLVAAQWVKLVPGDKPFRTVTQNTRGPERLPFHAPLSVIGTVVRDGEQVIEIDGVAGKGSAKRQVKMFVRPAAPHVPIGYDAVGVVHGVTITVQSHFSDFGKRVRISAPHDAVSYRALVEQTA